MNSIGTFFLLSSLLCAILPFYLANTNTTKISVTVWRRGKSLTGKSSLCPKEGFGWAFNNATKSCEKVGVQGSCGALMKFTRNATNGDYGYCVCDFYKQCGRPVIQWPATGKCYFVNERGPCSEDEWITLKEDRTPVCSPNSCKLDESKAPSNGSKFWFSSENGTCYQTHTRGYCQNEQALLIFGREDFKPTCKFGLACGAINGTSALNTFIKTWNLSLKSNGSGKGGESIYTTLNK